MTNGHFGPPLLPLGRCLEVGRSSRFMRQLIFLVLNSVSWYICFVGCCVNTYCVVFVHCTVASADADQAHRHCLDSCTNNVQRPAPKLRVLWTLTMAQTSWDSPMIVACTALFLLNAATCCVALKCVYCLDPSVIAGCGILLTLTAWMYPSRRLCTYFEIIDLLWLPTYIKHCLQDNMYIKWRIAFALGAIDVNIIQRVQGACVDGKEATFIALGAGGGGIEPFLLSHLRSVIPNASLVMTDLVPNIPTWRKVQAEFGKTVSWVETSVDGTNLPTHLSGIRILTGSLHHFSPPLVTRIFQDAVSRQQPIIVIDGVPTFLNLCTLPFNSFCLCCTITVYLLTQAITSARSATELLRNLLAQLPRLLLTITCVLPLIQAHDMFVSVLRFYGESDMKGIIATMPNSQQFTWSLYYPQSKNLSIVVGLPKHDHTS
jgi:hypothetical protein